MTTLLLLSMAHAHSAGETGVSTSGCTPCHASSGSASVTSTLSASASTVAPGDTLDVELLVASTSSSHTGAGLDVSATGGTFGAGSNTRVSASEVTHSSATSFGGGSSVTFDFTWTAPSAEGSYALRATGQAVNGNGAQTGDGWDLASNLTITVDDGCDDLDGDTWEDCDGDCDDDDAYVNPDASESCNGYDDDCDGEVDEDDAIDAFTGWDDDDGDGYGDPAESMTGCAIDAGYTDNDNDCDDTDSAVSPAATELCDTIDNDCDGDTDESDAADAISYYLDYDGDGHGDPDSVASGCSAPSGYVAAGNDCDDTRASVSPSGTEVCDSIDSDEDCDGLIDDADDSVTGRTTWYADADADGYGTADSTTEACDLPAGHAATAEDCDDGDPAYNPGASEADCTDLTDWNCDGSVGFADADGDGYAACEDCDDGDASERPGGDEVCDGGDDDCDGTVDEDDASDATAWYADADADGFGDPWESTVACAAPEGWLSDASDCDDEDAGIYPGAIEVWYDSVDQDCDGNDTDQDGDGVFIGTDCDDTNAGAYPGAEDAWYDGVDADCAGDDDYDADLDGYGSASHGGDDCDDADASAYPGAEDQPYDGVVTDCDEADEYDVDGDGSVLEEDCDDANSAIHPAAEETWYDGVDQDCDSNDDDQDADGVPVDADCDDLDAAIGEECPDLGDSGDTGVPRVDSGEPQVEDTGSPAKRDCGCDTGGVAGAAFLFLALGTRRRC